MNALRKTLTWTGAAVAGLVVLLLILAAALAAGVSSLVAEWGGPATVHIDGETFSLGELDFGSALAVAAALLLAGLVVAVVVPVALGFAALVVTLALVAAVGAPLLAVGLVVALLASPLLLIVGLLWLVFRTRRPRATTTMAT